MRFAAALTAILTAGFLAQASAQPVAPAGSRIAIAPPPGFVPTDTISGFRGQQPGSSINFQEFPANAYPEASAAMTAPAMATRGMTVQSREPFAVAGASDAILLRVEQTQGGVVFRRWVVLAQAPGFTALVTISSPRDLPDALDDPAALAALRTLALRAEPEGDPVAALPFALTPGTRLSVPSVIGRSLALSDRALGQQPDPRAPLMVALAEDRAVPEGLRETYARTALTGVAGVAGADMVTAPPAPATLDGLPALRHRVAVPSRGGSPARTITAWYVFDQSRTYAIMAMIPQEDAAALQPEVDAIAASFRRR